MNYKSTTIQNTAVKSKCTEYSYRDITSLKDVSIVTTKANQYFT